MFLGRSMEFYNWFYKVLILLKCLFLFEIIKWIVVIFKILVLRVFVKDKFSFDFE